MEYKSLNVRKNTHTELMKIKYEDDFEHVDELIKCMLEIYKKKKED